MRKTVYVETTVPSAYVSTRTDPGSLHRRAETRLWWSNQLPLYEALLSPIVLLELERGQWTGQTEALELVRGLPELPVDEEVLGVARRYAAECLVPDNLTGDAAHLAIACVHEVDFLLTWNIRHLANPNKLEHLVVINRRLGLLTPQIVTPEMLWLEADNP
ncbi:MAG: type II toxin-antitoxin system VapC family toxin [Planctomycetes bacterium]|nr:type II toxin-antitoxin system VapC family toxin [Planctomycetota bacterium]